MRVLNLVGHKCPQPVLQTKKYLSNLLSGEIVTVITDDPDSQQDLQQFCQKTGNLIQNQSIKQQLIITTIQRK